MTYRVLKHRLEKTTETGYDAEGKPFRYFAVAEVQHLGFAEDMADALRKFPRCKANGYSPILEWIGTIQ
jgi:hypothetical protein